MTRMAGGGYFALATAPLPATLRRDFWRDTALSRSDADFPGDAATDGFSASVSGYLGARAELRDGRSDAVILRRGAARCRRDGGDEILLSTIVAADQAARYQSSTASLLIPTGRFVVNDMAVPFDIEMPRYRSINFRLPRAAAAPAILAHRGGLSGRLLRETPLTSLLFEQLVRLADRIPAMDDAAREVALDATADFALATLRLEARAEPWDEDADSTGLWLAAARFIERNLDRAELNPDSVARALRCSRTHLYRLFSRHDTTVMEQIRERRLKRCREMLGDPECRLSIAEIAALCGMDDASAFSRGFRRRFGCSPGDLRRRARGSG